MKKIYILALHLAYGGVEKAICNMANAFAQDYDVEIISMYDMENAPAYLLAKNVSVRYLLKDTPNRSAFRNALQRHNPFLICKEGFKAVKILFLKKHCLKKAIREIKDGIIISTRNEDSVLLSKYGNDHVRKIAQLHHDHAFDKRLKDDFQKHYQNIDVFVLLCDQLKQEVQQMMEGWNTHTQCVAIPNFLDEIPPICDLDKKEKICIAVGRLHPIKGFDRMIQAFHQFHAHHPDWCLQIVGDGEEETHLRSLIHSLDASSYIHLLGAKNSEEIQQLMQKASLYLMTSHSEGIPFVLLEAMSCALPMVAYDVRVGPGAVICDKENGYLIRDNQMDAYVQTLNTIVSDENLRKKMSVCAYETVLIYEKQTVLAKWKDILREECCECSNS